MKDKIQKTRMFMNSIKSLIILNSSLIARKLSKICQKYSSGKKTKNTNNEKTQKM